MSLLESLLAGANAVAQRQQFTRQQNEAERAALESERLEELEINERMRRLEAQLASDLLLQTKKHDWTGGQNDLDRRLKKTLSDDELQTRRDLQDAELDYRHWSDAIQDATNRFGIQTRADTSRYVSDNSLAGTQYSADRGYDSTRYAADSRERIADADRFARTGPSGKELPIEEYKRRSEMLETMNRLRADAARGFMNKDSEPGMEYARFLMGVDPDMVAREAELYPHLAHYYDDALQNKEGMERVGGILNFVPDLGNTKGGMFAGSGLGRWLHGTPQQESLRY